MSVSLTIPLQLTLLLRREALSDYAVACERAAAAAERCVVMACEPTDLLGEFRKCRATVVSAAETLDVVGDDIATAEAWDVSLDDSNRDLLFMRISVALDRVSRDLESSAPEILEAADQIEQLRAVLATFDRTH